MKECEKRKKMKKKRKREKREENKRQKKLLSVWVGIYMKKKSGILKLDQKRKSGTTNKSRIMI